MFSPLKGRDVIVNWLYLANGHPSLTNILNFWYSGTLALRAERQSERTSEI